MIPLLNIILLVILVILCATLLWRLFYSTRKISGGITISEFNDFGICDAISHLNAYLLTIDLLIERLKVFNTYAIPQRPGNDADYFTKLLSLVDAMVDPKRCEKLYVEVANIRSSGSQPRTLYRIIDFYKNVALVLSFYVKRYQNNTPVYKTAQKLMYVINNIDVVRTNDYYDVITHTYSAGAHIPHKKNYKSFVKDMIETLSHQMGKAQTDEESDNLGQLVTIHYDVVYAPLAANSEYTQDPHPRNVEIRDMKFTLPTAYMVFTRRHTMLYDVLKQTLVDDNRRFRCEWTNIREYLKLANRKEKGVFLVKGNYTETYDLNDFNASVFMLSCLHNAGFPIHHYASSGALNTLNVPTPEINFDTIDYYNIKSSDLQLYRKTRTVFLWANMQHYRSMWKQVDTLSPEGYIPALKEKILKRYQQANAALYDLWNPDSLDMPLLNNQFTQSFTWKQIQYRAYGWVPLMDGYVAWINRQAKMLSIDQQFECPYTTYFDESVINWLKDCGITGNFDGLTIPFTIVPRPELPEKFPREEIPTDNYAYVWGNRPSPIQLPIVETLPPPPPSFPQPPDIPVPPPPSPSMSSPSMPSSMSDIPVPPSTPSPPSPSTPVDDEPERLPTPPSFYEDMTHLQL